MKTLTLQEWTKVFKPPFRYEPAGQMIFDADENQALDVRGWGRAQKMKNAVEMQDGFGQWVADTLNAQFKPSEEQKPEAEKDYGINTWTGFSSGDFSEKKADSVPSKEETQEELWKQVFESTRAGRYNEIPEQYFIVRKPN